MLKEKVLAEHVSAIRERDRAKSALLSVIKGQMTALEKAGQTVDDQAVVKICLGLKKGVDETLAVKSDAALERELGILQSFLPQPLTREELTSIIKEIISGMPSSLPRNAKVGKTMGVLNKSYPGMIDAPLAMELIGELMSE
jgi:uncharacterized protein YqeY